LKILQMAKALVSPRLRFTTKSRRKRNLPFRRRFVWFRFVSPRRPAPRRYSTGAGLTANGPSDGETAALSSRG
jgi:hypothetical protein